MGNWLTAPNATRVHIPANAAPGFREGAREAIGVLRAVEAGDQLSADAVVPAGEPTSQAGYTAVLQTVIPFRALTGA